MTTGLPDFFKHNLWANQRLLDECASLTDEQLDFSTVGVHGSVRETLMHLFTSEEGYARTLTGENPMPPLERFTEFPGFDELRRRAVLSGEKLIRFAEQPGDLYKIQHLDGGTYDAPVVITVIQAINHGVDHRSQIATLLSQQGIQLPDNFLDAWAYNDATLNKE
jgi:uncharacterized damage-inducible protein DinB